jgi:hypothetical protein
VDSDKGFGGVPVAYAFIYPKDRIGQRPDFRETLLWSPALPAKNGQAQAAFDLPDNITTFRILVYGHTLDGRLGVAHGKLVSQPPQSGNRKTEPK